MRGSEKFDRKSLMLSIHLFFSVNRYGVYTLLYFVATSNKGAGKNLKTKNFSL